MNGKDARGTDREEGPEIVYVPHYVPCNSYNPEYEAIILDERLKEWPEVHDHILEHELKHYEYGGSLVGHIRSLILDIRTDWMFHVSTGETSQRISEYYDSKPKGDSSFIEWHLRAVMNTIRGLLGVIIVPTGLLYRTLREKSEWALERIQKVMA